MVSAYKSYNHYFGLVTQVFTAYNAYVDADACCIGAMANAALFQHFPLPSSMVQNPVPTVQELQEKVKIYHIANTP